MLDIDVFGPSNPFADSLMTSYDDVMANASKEDLEAAEIEDENGDFGDFCLSGDSRTIRITMMPILEQGSTQIGQNGLEDGESASNDPIDSANFFKQNAVNIFMRYICKDSSQSVDLPDSLGTEIWDKICAQEGVNSYCFVSAQNHVYSILLNEYFESFLSSSHFVNYQLDRITCRNVTLTDVLFCHVTIAYFMEFLQTITLQNLVSCFLSIQNFKLNYDMHCSLSDANSIFNSYFNENSLSTFVQFPEPVISVVEKQILQAKKISMSPESETCEVKIPSSVFDCAFVILGNVLKTEVFPFFLKSRYYRQLKRELEVSFFAMQGASSRDKSDRYAGLSRGTECETLLKADAKGPMVQEPRFVFPIEDESIETIRRKPVKQTLGHVNAIGEYVSQYESLPGGMQGKESVRSKLKQLLTPGRSKKVAEAEEQEAWVTAHKIVNQVNRETLDTGGNIAVNTRINTPESQKHRKYTNISDIWKSTSKSNPFSYLYIRSLYQIKTFLVHCYDNAFFRYAAVPTLIMLTTVFVHLLELDSI